MRHSLSPLIHNAWIAAAGIDGVYVAFAPHQDRFKAFAEGLRGGAIRGLNVTIPFKEQALAVADEASVLAKAAGAANLLLFHEDGRIEARNTDGEGLLQALAAQAPGFDLRAGPAVVLGAGGAARGAVAALIEAGAQDIRLCNRTLDRAETLVEDLSGFGSDALVRAFERPDEAVEGCGCVINATSLGLGGGPGPDTPWRLAAPGGGHGHGLQAPRHRVAARGARQRADRASMGLSMLINQAKPSFEAFYGARPAGKLGRCARPVAAEAGGGRVIVLGLTGSIGMGKSTTASLFREAGVPVQDADQVVAELYAQAGAAVGPVGEAFPGRDARRRGRPRRRYRRTGAWRSVGVCARLEVIVHPLVRAERERFLAASKDAEVVVFDVPLLLETGVDQDMDAVVVVSAPESVQRERVLARPDMTEAKLAQILARQTPDAEKRARADFVIDTSRGIEAAREQVRAVLDEVRAGAEARF